MNEKQARQLLRTANEDEPVLLTPAILQKLDLSDVQDGCGFQVGQIKGGVHHLDWNGAVHRRGSALVGEADHTWTRKYWYSPIGLEQYLDLVRRAVEARQKSSGDTEVSYQDDDGAYVALRFEIATAETNLSKAYLAVRRVAEQVEEAASDAADEVGKRIAEVAARLSGWGSLTLDALVDAVENASNNQAKGRSLEELCARLFETVAGMTVTQRILTETEEIDISLINGSDEARLKREGAIILAECKNWSGKCGKNEFVVFRSKLENRAQRATLGFLISWNGFAETVTKEMLRGSREDLLIVPLAGDDLRRAVRDSDFTKVMLRAWDAAVAM
ncbi:Restriction endonuclease [Sphingomonas sp. OV641]|uniref:restriction endonuclease n=1 Tax=Sphingomonas sp. OV641 TaxID=1881068 RepID=UPI0008D6F551|nr:restriction endonuclease [Sphingomonas sp. OV641]SEJ31177.1 Restriction endonuclease [Sphingomonas sp. OV641]